VGRYIDGFSSLGFFGYIRTPTQGLSCYGMTELSREKFPSLYLSLVESAMILCNVYDHDVSRAFIRWFMDCFALLYVCGFICTLYYVAHLALFWI
jgi:hypothetical protein